MDKPNTDLGIGHWLPYLVWIGAIGVLQIFEMLGACPRALYPWSYAVKTVLCAVLFLAFKPWKVYPSLSLQHMPVALGAGVLVAVLWIVPEMPAVAERFPAFHDFYNRWCILMPGTLPSYDNPAFFPALPPGHLSLAYSPAEAGWGLVGLKVFGSAVVIAVIEEFFFRGFLYRWLRGGAWAAIPLTVFESSAFWMVAALFAFEHDRWLAGLAAGVVYGVVAVKTGDIWSAALAHGLTNLLLALYVLGSGQYGFW